MATYRSLSSYLSFIRYYQQVHAQQCDAKMSQTTYTHAQPNTVPLSNFVISRKNTVNVVQEQEQAMFTLCQRKKLHLHKSLVLCQQTINFSRACFLVHYRRSNFYCIICNLINLTHLLIIWFKHFTKWWWCVKHCSDFD